MGVSGVDSDERCFCQFCWCRDDDDVVDADFLDDGGAELEVAAAEDEALGAYRAEDEFHVFVLLEQGEKVVFVEVVFQQGSLVDGVDAE